MGFFDTLLKVGQQIKTEAEKAVPQVQKTFREFQTQPEVQAEAQRRVEQPLIGGAGVGTQRQLIGEAGIGDRRQLISGAGVGTRKQTPFRGATVGTNVITRTIQDRSPREILRGGRGFDTPVTRAVRSVGGFGVDIARAPLRAVVGVGLEPAAGILSLIQKRDVPARFQPKSKLQRLFLGDEEIKGVFEKTEEAQRQTEALARKMNLSPEATDRASLIFAPMFVAGSTALDLTPIGGARKRIAKEAKEIAGKTVAQDILPNLKKIIKAEDDVLQPLARSLENVNNPNDVEKILGNYIKSKRVFNKSGEVVEQQFRGDKLDLDDIAKIEKDRERLNLTTRNVRSFDEVERLAEEIGTDPKQLLKDTTKNRITDKEVVALRNLINQNSQRMVNLEKKLASPAVTKKESRLIKEEISTLQKQVDVGLKKLIKGGTEAGRAVASFKILANRTMNPDFWLVKAKKLSGKDELSSETISMIQRLAEEKDRLGMVKLMGELQKNTLGEKIVTAWKAGLLTSPTTHLANLGGNSTMFALENIARLPAFAVDSLVSLGTKRRTKVAPGFKLVRQQLKGAKAGVQEGIEFLKNGVTQAEMAKWDVPKQVTFKNRFLQGYTQGIFRTLGAEDKVFKNAKLQESLFEQAKLAFRNKDDAYHAAKKALERQGKEVDKKNVFNYLVENPTDEMSLRAIDDAEFVVFQSENALAKAIAGAKRAVKKSDLPAGGFASGAIEFLAPFTKTPTNIASRIVDYTPVGVARTLLKQLKKDGRFTRDLAAQKAFSEMLGRGLTGSGIMALGAYLGTRGLVTGDYPTDPNERFLWQQEGKQPNSIFVGGKWRNMDKISPLGNLMSLGSKVQKIREEGSSGVDLFAKAAASGVKGLTEQSFLKGLSGGLGALTDPEREAGTFVRQSVGSTVPSIVGRIARTVDPVKREQERWYEGAQAKIPYLSKRLPQKLDAFGQEQQYENGLLGLGQIFDPFRSTEAVDTPLVLELRRLKDADFSVRPTQLQKNTSIDGTKIQYDQNELNVLKSVIGNVLKPILEQIVETDEYKALPDKEKQKVLDRVSDRIFSEIKEANPPFGTGILRRADIEFNPEHGTKLNLVMSEIVETKDWKNLTEDQRVELTRKIYESIERSAEEAF